ncbi:UbiA prenyltransferase [Paramyrothecium foliicola]|nr:UbiA prenyltransferase [Paramyrothecium foliicola]
MSQKPASNGVSEKAPRVPPSPAHPKVGLVAYLPDAWAPYGELARIHRPTGVLLFYLPHLFGTLYATSLLDEASRSFWDVAQKNLILLGGCIFFRPAVCSWNDTIDRDFDAQVARCASRPIPRGAVTVQQAHVLTVTMTLFALAFLYALPQSCWIVSVPDIFLLGLYPFAKRFTDYPQAILGLQIALGFFMGLAAMDPGFVGKLTELAFNPTDPNGLAMGAFYLANACWTVVYDTVYAQQDVADDAKAGVRSMAVRFRGKERQLLWTLVLALVGFLAACGYWQNFSLAYFTIACGGTLSSLSYMLLTIDFKNGDECSWWFEQGYRFVAVSITLGLVSQCIG